MSLISDAQARRIASEWHGGQASALYSLASCGAVDLDRLAAEIDREVKLLTGDRGIGEDDIQGYRELQALSSYILGAGERGPQSGWSGLWDDTPVTEERA